MKSRKTSQDMPAALAGGAYLFILMVQLLAIFWTQSRGPWLGLFLGVYIFVLLDAQRAAARVTTAAR